MGTRHLITIISKAGETKVAQYGQWDGYPTGQGVGIIEQLRKLDTDKLEERILKLRWITDKEIKEVDKTVNWSEKYPWLTRDAGCEVIGMLMEDAKIESLSNSEDFAADSLFCEYAYVIDLQKHVFEIYKGFNKTPLTENERYYHLTEKAKKEDGTIKYYPVKFIRAYSLNCLPSAEELEAFEQCMAEQEE